MRPASALFRIMYREVGSSNWPSGQPLLDHVRTLQTSFVVPMRRKWPNVSALTTANAGQCVVRKLVTAYKALPSTVAHRSVATSNVSKEPHITPIKDNDFEEWTRLFRAYIGFYKSNIPESRYKKTFERLIDPNKDLYGLVLRDPDNKSKLLGVAHYYPHQTPWSEKQIMHFNDLFVEPSLRGKGYGRKMILAVAEQAKDMGCFRLEWATKHDNPARRLYDELAACDFVEYRMKFEDF